MAWWMWAACERPEWLPPPVSADDPCVRVEVVCGDADTVVTKQCLAGDDLYFVVPEDELVWCPEFDDLDTCAAAAEVLACAGGSA